MTESHSDVAYDDAVLRIEALGSSGSGLAYSDVLNSEDVADVLVLDYLCRIISLRIVAELLYILLLASLSFLYRGSTLLVTVN